MCTLTFIPVSTTDFILTSNRDEAPGRETIPPQEYEEGGVKLLYPKDTVAGGTWIGVSERQRIISLMNGGFVAHKPEPPYVKSRGVVVKELLQTENLMATVKAYNFKGIEPFTSVIVDWNIELKMFQLIWDGADSHFTTRPLIPQIWSSSLLYSEGIKLKREQWFSELLKKARHPSKEMILNFHKTAGEGDSVNSLIMDRGFVKTKSITQIEKNNSELSMRYEDLKTEKDYSFKFIAKLS